jgi:acetyl-CoA carboxylase biotin carboxyl carrier protein
MPKTPPKSAEKDIIIKPLTTTVLDRIAAYLAKSGLEEIEISQGDNSVRLKRPGAAPAAVAPAAMPQAVEPQQEARQNIFAAPMIGTFYRAAGPDAQPFVKEGDTVKAGQVLCIIEAMKTMNQIESDRAGKILKIPAVNATPVEFGQPLFIFE